jgi:hypothetical protein
MRALMNFMHNRGCSFHIVAEDCKTILVGYRTAPSREALLRIVAKLGGSVADAETDIRRWNRGSVWIELSPAQCQALAIQVGQIPDTSHRATTGTDSSKL